MSQTPPPRPITHRYEDPVDALWRRCAARLGLAIRRSDDAFASFDGASTLTIATDAELDPDDSLAQIVFHELCHALVAGDVGARRPDWGLENVDDRDLVQEHACHRLQAALAGRWGLRAFMAVTTRWRPYWDALPADPLADGDDPAIPLAREAFLRSRAPRWRAALDDALGATAAIAAALGDGAEPDTLWAEVPPLHPLGGPSGRADATCGGCAWRHRAGPGRPVERCRQHRRPGAVAPRIDPAWRACERFEPALTEAACPRCGACCREGFHLVPVGAREPLLRRHAGLAVQDAHGWHLPRPDGRCVALEIRRDPGGASLLCRIYADRPRSCRDFEVGGDPCLEARRRVGLSARPPLADRIEELGRVP